MNIPSKAFLGLIVFLSLTSYINAQYYNEYNLNGKVKSFYKKTYDNSKDGYLDTINPSEQIFVDFQNRKETKNHKKNVKANISVKYYDENKNIILDSIYTKRDYVEITKFYYDLKGKRLKNEEYRNDSIQSITTYKYDGFDNLIERLTDYNDKSSQRIFYTYDSKNNETSNTCYSSYFEPETYIREYNKKGQMIKKYSPNTKNNYTLFKYDQKGNLIKEIEYDDNEYISKKIYIYNSQNKLTKEKSYLYNELSSTKTYIYDSLNREVQTISWKKELYFKPIKDYVKFDGKGRLIEIKTYRVDAPPRIQSFIYKGNNLVQEIVDEPSDSYNQTHKIEYTYNTDNTLSRKVRYSYVDGVRENIKWKESEVEEYSYNSKKQNTFIKNIVVYPHYIGNDSLIYENGLLDRRFDYENNNIQTSYKYDEKGRLIEEDINNSNRTLITYKYGNDTLICKREEIYRADTLDYCVIEKWEYNSNKKLIENIYNHPYFSTKTNYFYNSKGKLKKTISKNNEGYNIISNYKYKLFSKDYTIIYSDSSNIKNVYYKYDDKGNLIEERHPSYLVKFEYEYYE